MTWVVGVGAVAIAAATLYLGRRDVTRPAVAFGVIWFGCVALAQLRLTRVETQWPTGFAVLVFVAGLAFMLAAVLAGGTAAARFSIRVPRDEYVPRRLLVAGGVLVAGAIVGTAYKAHVLGGLPLLSGETDVLRSRAFRNGQVVVPAWSTALTDGFFLAMWCFLAAFWLMRGRATRRQLVAVAALAAGCLFGVALLASRNSILFALAPPIVATYLLARPRKRLHGAGLLVAAGAVVALIVGGLFVVRLAQGEGRDTFLHREMDRRPAIVRPLLPFYINAVYPLEAASRVYRAVPGAHEYASGGASLTSLPDAFFPNGKPPIGTEIADLMSTPAQTDAPTWSVAGYEGRLYADAGWPAVVLGSLLLGFAFGALYRWARRRAGFFAVALVGFVAWYSAFLVYDNILSFSLIAIYDLAVVAAVSLYARGNVRANLAALVEVPDAAVSRGVPARSAAGTLRNLGRRSGAALALVLLLAAALWIYAGRDLTFPGDAWDFAYGRRGGGLESFLRSHNEHPVMTVVAYYKVMWSTFGLSQHWPYVVANVLVSLGAVVLIFELFRRRVGLAAAFAAAVLLAFFGRGYSVVLGDFNMSFLLSVVAGVAAFELYRRHGVAAAALLTLSIASASWGLIFALAIVVALGLAREWRRLAVPLVPLALYAVWYSKYGYGGFDLARLPHVPRFVADAMSSTLANLAGLPLMWGRVLAGVAVAAVVARFLRTPRPGPVQTAALLLPLLAWVVTGLGRAGTESPLTGRYTWPFAVLVLVAAAHVLPRILPSRRTLAVTAVLVAGAVATNLSDLRTAVRLERTSAQTRLTTLGAVDVSRPSVAPSHGLTSLGAYGHFRAEWYFAATDAYGSPGYDERELRALSVPLKLVADSEMLRAAPPRLVEGARPGNPAPAPPAAPGAARCVSTNRLVELRLPSRGIVVTPRPGRAVNVSYRRFSPTYPAQQSTTVSVRAGIVPPVTRAVTPWTVRLASPAPFRLCGGPAA